jgi:hypothetical protein
MKHFLSGFATCAVICSLLFVGTSAIAGSPIQLVIDGEVIQCDVPPQIINGRVMVPARFVAEPLGAMVEWDKRSQAVMIMSPEYEKSLGGGLNTSTTSATTINQEKYEVQAKISHTDATISKAIDKYADKDYQAAIDELKALEHEWVAWGTLDEYTRIKELYLQAIRSLGYVAINKRTADNGVNSYKHNMEAKSYLGIYEGTLPAIQAEITSLKKKGYL